jgi:flavodoxin
MKTYLVLYYSKTGNSKFIADKLSHELACDSKEITPMFNSLLILFLLSLLRINIPTNIVIEDISKYDEIIIIGPIWGGLLISPLRTVLNKSLKASKNIYFSVTCETKEEDKDSKYGYSQVLKKARDLGGKFIKNTEAFPTSLVNFGNKQWSPKLSEKIKINEDNYSGVLKLRVENFANKIKST